MEFFKGGGGGKTDILSDMGGQEQKLNVLMYSRDSRREGEI